MVRTHFTQGTDTNVAVKWYFSYTGGPPSTTDCLTLATAIRGSAVTQIASIINTQTTLTNIEVVDLSSATAASNVASGSNVGSQPGTPLPANVCFLVNMAVARRYRGGKPRSYWPLGTSADTSGAQIWSGASISAWMTKLNAYRTFILGQTAGTTVIATHANVSYYQGFTVITDPVTGRARNVPKLRTGGPHVDTITGMAANPRFGTQRRRVNA